MGQHGCRCRDRCRDSDKADHVPVTAADHRIRRIAKLRRTLVAGKCSTKVLMNKLYPIVMCIGAGTGGELLREIYQSHSDLFTSPQLYWLYSKDHTVVQFCIEKWPRESKAFVEYYRRKFVKRRAYDTILLATVSREGVILDLS